MEVPQVQLVWDRFSRQMLAFLRSKVPSAETAEDLLQELFIRVHTKLCCLEELTSLENWLYRVARNLIIDYYRTRHHNLPLDDGTAAAGFEESPDFPDDPVTRLAFSLRETAEGLREPYRSALIKVDYEGLTVAGYASQTGISLSAAKSRILRAREQLKQLLLECCHFEFDRLGGIVNYEKRCAECDLRRAAGSS